MPLRLQRKRTKGYRLPVGSVCVTRPSIFGNPFTPAGCRSAGYEGTDEEIRQRCVSAFRIWLGPHWRECWDGEESERRRAELLRRLPELRGKNLACYCPPNRQCHADVLIELANK